METLYHPSILLLVVCTCDQVIFRCKLLSDCYKYETLDKFYLLRDFNLQFFYVNPYLRPFCMQGNLKMSRKGGVTAFCLVPPVSNVPCIHRYLTKGEANAQEMRNIILKIWKKSPLNCGLIDSILSTLRLGNKISFDIFWMQHPDSSQRCSSMKC